MTKNAKDLLSILGQNNYNISQDLVNMLEYIITIAYNFNYQDFPEFYEDNLADWINILKATCNISMIKAGPSFLQLNIISLKLWNKYISSYYDDIKDYFSELINPIWGLMLQSKDFDKEESYSLINEILEYFKALALFKRYQFEMNDITNLITCLILPQISISNKEINDFEDNPIAYLKSELEEADYLSNQAVAIVLLKTLNENYESLFDTIIKPSYISFLEEYKSNPKSNWSKKALGVNLIFSSIINRFSNECKY